MDNRTAATAPHAPPETIDLLISPRWLIPVVPRGVCLEQHSLAVHDGKILALLPTHEAWQRFLPREHHELSEHLLIPGLINLHTHAAMSLMRGIADDLPLMDWLQKHIWPAEAAHVSPEFVRDGTALACLEMLKGGITCFNDMYFYPDAAAEAVVESGMRAVLGITALEFPTRYASDAEDYLNKGLACHERWQAHPQLGFCLAPHAPYTVSDATFERIRVLAEQLDLPIHLHLHETAGEIGDSLRQYGQRPLERLEKLGLLSPRLLAVHAVHMNEADIERCAHYNVSIAHCPTSNLKLASGMAPVDRFLAAGLTVGLGTDSAASNNRLDILQEMRLAALLAKGRSADATVVPAWQALEMATLNAARALGLGEQLGSLETGKLADLCALRLDASEVRPVFDPCSHLTFVCGREQVSHVWVGGKCCILDSKPVQECEKGLNSRIGLWQNRLQIC